MGLMSLVAAVVEDGAEGETAVKHEEVDIAPVESELFLSWEGEGPRRIPAWMCLWGLGSLPPMRAEWRT